MYMAENKKYLLGIVKIMSWVEERYEEEEHPRKYKHYISVSIFGKSVLTAIIRSSSEGLYWVEGEAK